MAGGHCAATLEVEAHLSVKPCYSVSVSETLQATSWLDRGFLLLKALNFRLEHKRPYYGKQVVLEQDIFHNLIQIQASLLKKKKLVLLWLLSVSLPSAVSQGRLNVESQRYVEFSRRDLEDKAHCDIQHTYNNNYMYNSAYYCYYHWLSRSKWVYGQPLSFVYFFWYNISIFKNHNFIIFIII